DAGRVAFMAVEVELAVAPGKLEGAPAGVAAEPEGVGDLGRGECAVSDAIGLLLAGQDPGRLEVPGAERVVARLHDLLRADTRGGEDVEGDRGARDLEAVIAGLGVEVPEIPRRLDAPLRDVVGGQRAGVGEPDAVGIDGELRGSGERDA